MNKKKILWIILLIAVITIIVLAVVFAKPRNNDNTNIQITTTFNKISNIDPNNNEVENKKQIDNQKDKEKQYIKTELEDGVLYSIEGKKVEPDMIIGDNYFDTTITDIYLNPQNYSGKKIQIEGMYLLSDPKLQYTFVGRYSLNSLCPSCPAGYSVMEYQLKGNIDAQLVDEDSWIKVIGTLSKGNDETSNFEDYYYLDVISLEVMNEKGQLTVNN